MDESKLRSVIRGILVETAMIDRPLDEFILDELDSARRVLEGKTVQVGIMTRGETALDPDRHHYYHGYEDGVNEGVKAALEILNELVKSVHFHKAHHED